MPARRFVSGALWASAVFAAFAGYAFFATAAYRAIAIVNVTTTGVAEPSVGPLEAARQLREQVLTQDILVELASWEGGGTPTATVVSRTRDAISSGHLICTK